MSEGTPFALNPAFLHNMLTMFRLEAERNGLLSGEDDAKAALAEVMIHLNNLYIDEV